MKVDRPSLLAVAERAEHLAAEVARSVGAHEVAKYGPDKHTYNAIELVQALDEWRALRRPLWEYLETLDDTMLSTLWGLVRLGRESVRRGPDANLGDVEREWLSAEEMGTTDRDGTIQAICATPTLVEALARGRALASTGGDVPAREA
jgi:hypothetical protein